MGALAVAPFIGTAAVPVTGNLYAGLYYPMGVAAITFVVGSFCLNEGAETEG